MLFLIFIVGTSEKPLPKLVLKVNKESKKQERDQKEHKKHKDGKKHPDQSEADHSHHKKKKKKHKHQVRDYFITLFIKLIVSFYVMYLRRTVRSIFNCDAPREAFTHNFFNIEKTCFFDF